MVITNLNQKFISTYIFLICVDGLIKGLFSKIGIYYLAYLKDLFLLFVLTLFVFELVGKGKIKVLTLSLLIVVFIAIVNGSVNGISVLQSLFALKVFLPFIVAIVSYKYLDLNRLKSLGYLLIILSLLGLILDLIFRFTWIGSTENIAGMEVAVGAEGTIAGGVRRLAGFGSSNGSTGFNILALWLFIISDYIVSKVSFRIKDIFISLLAFIGILLTTNKTCLLVFLLVLSYGLIINLNWSYWLRIFGKEFLRLFVIFYAFVPVVFAFWYYYTFGTPSANMLNIGMGFTSEVAFGTLIHRVIFIWPSEIEFLEAQNQLFFGRGLGGIGVAQKIFENNLYNPGDGMFMTFTAIFGLIITSIFFIFLSIKMFIWENLLGQVLILAILAISTTHNFIDIPGILIVFGLLVSQVYYNTHEFSS